MPGTVQREIEALLPVVLPLYDAARR